MYKRQTLVISTDSGGPSDFINSNNGILLKQANANEISKALYKVVHDYSSYDLKKISKAIHAQYGAENICDSIIKQYQSMS